jgi:hypothetical protein
MEIKTGSRWRHRDTGREALVLDVGLDLVRYRYGNHVSRSQRVSTTPTKFVNMFERVTK